jgi:hypothetical protein
MTTVTYHGKRDKKDQLENIVWIETVAVPGHLPNISSLPLRTDLRNHSPTGFEWGYAGSGPAQLALALLVDATDRRTALEHYMAYKNEVVARLPKAGWTIDRESILNFIRQQEQKEQS